MLALKSGIERPRATVETQAALLAQHGQGLDEQAAMILRGFKEHAELRGELTQRAVRLQTATGDLLAGVRGPAMTDHISEVCQVVSDEKLGSIGADMGKAKLTAEHHEAREREMAAYLEGLAGERPTEGRFITGKFELYDRSFSQVQAELARQHSSFIDQFAAMAASSVVERTELEQMNGQIAALASAHEAVKANGNIASFAGLQVRLAALEVEIQRISTSTAQSAASPAVEVNPFACGLAGQTPGANLTVPPGIPGIPACFSLASGGNGSCHCVHLVTLGKEDLPNRVLALEGRMSSVELRPDAKPVVPG
jgi:hypothetical protein